MKRAWAWFKNFLTKDVVIKLEPGHKTTPPPPTRAEETLILRGTTHPGDWSMDGFYRDLGHYRDIE